MVRWLRMPVFSRCPRSTVHGNGVVRRIGALCRAQDGLARAARTGTGLGYLHEAVEREERK
eukprot:1748193-Prymnesium_polylepis.1